MPFNTLYRDIQFPKLFLRNTNLLDLHTKILSPYFIEVETEVLRFMPREISIASCSLQQDGR